MAYTILDALRDMGKGDLQLVSQELKDLRVMVCKSCPEYGALLNQCKVCHCLVEGKTWLQKATCPKGKWK
jgi:hypothetical protein